MVQTRSSAPELQLSFRDCQIQLDAYLASVLTSTENFAMLVTWDRDNLNRIVNAMNVTVRNVDPVWLTRVNGHVTQTSFVTDVVRFLATMVGVTAWGRVCFAPLNVTKCSTIVETLASCIHLDPLIQECMNRGRCGVVMTMAMLKARADGRVTVADATEMEFDRRYLPHDQIAFYQ